MANIDLIKRRVIIAAGHGGGDPGAVGQGTIEAAECIDIVNRVVDFLRKDGQVEVIQVPNELSFEQTMPWINARYKDIDDGVALEVHKNSTNNAHGVETWYPDDPDSKQIAQRIQDKVREVLPDRGVKPDTQNRWGRLGFCRDTNTWAMLVEMGFISAGGDPVGATANQRYAEAIGKGLLNIWNLSPRPPVVEPPVTPPVVTWTYKVVSTADGKQLGVYNVDTNAWAKYIGVDGAAKIIGVAGNDLTPQFIAKFGVKEPEQVPAYAPKEDVDALQSRVSVLESLVAQIVEFLSNMFKNFRS